MMNKDFLHPMSQNTPMNWEKLLNPERIGHRPSKTELGRTPYNSDHDKIIFSGAFRRLARKTQVHPLATNDHVHNRLTHSLEVACVGRSLGIRVGQILEETSKLANGCRATDIGDIVQSTCLAHDIGNPPFGHTGEAAIRNWFANDGLRYINELREEEQQDLKMFEGNAHGFRVLTTSEYHPYDGGMRLTYATLASFIKYPWTSVHAEHNARPKRDKFGVYSSELPLYREIADAVGLINCGEDWYCRHPLVYLMEAADDFCYGLIDLEDGLEMNILKWEEVYERLEGVIPAAEREDLKSDLQRVAYGRKPALVRGKVIAAYVESAAKAFIDNEDAFLCGKVDNDLINLCDDAIKDSVLASKELAKERIFSHPRKIELEIGAYNVISTLLDVMCMAVSEWVSDPEKISFRSQRALDLIGRQTFHPSVSAASDELTFSRKYQAIMRVLDFVGGMTDNYATYLAKQFNGFGDLRQ
jgi:dGTPase